MRSKKNITRMGRILFLLTIFSIASDLSTSVIVQKNTRESEEVLGRPIYVSAMSDDQNFSVAVAMLDATVHGITTSLSNGKMIFRSYINYSMLLKITGNFREFDYLKGREKTYIIDYGNYYCTRVWRDFVLLGFIPIMVTNPSLSYYHRQYSLGKSTVAGYSQISISEIVYSPRIFLNVSLSPEYYIPELCNSLGQIRTENGTYTLDNSSVRIGISKFVVNSTVEYSSFPSYKTLDTSTLPKVGTYYRNPNNDMTDFSIQYGITKINEKHWTRNNTVIASPFTSGSELQYVSGSAVFYNTTANLRLLKSADFYMDFDIYPQADIIGVSIEYVGVKDAEIAYYVDNYILWEARRREIFGSLSANYCTPDIYLGVAIANVVINVPLNLIVEVVADYNFTLTLPPSMPVPVLPPISSGLNETISIPSVGGITSGEFRREEEIEIVSIFETPEGIIMLIVIIILIVVIGAILFLIIRMRSQILKIKIE